MESDIKSDSVLRGETRKRFKYGHAHIVIYYEYCYIQQVVNPVTSSAAL